jgi:hypothetical protein
MGFRFTIIDDTDDATLENIKPIYDFLTEKNIFITKTVWVYPPRDRYSNGDSLQRKEYANYIKELSKRGFEIALHNVGSGDYDRKEILEGIEEFHRILGFYPRIHINHSYNKDSVYGGHKRFNKPFSYIIRKLYPQYAKGFQGDEEGSDYFWGDRHKELITFSRSHEFGDLNTLQIDKLSPYVDPWRNKYSNYWFSCSFAPNQNVFAHLLSNKNIDSLVENNGTAIVYTHFGYFMQNNKIDIRFLESINYLSSKKGGLFLPVSELLNTIAQERISNGKVPFPTIKYRQKFYFEFLHLWTRIYYRWINKIDDYSFKGLDSRMFTKD